MENKYHTFRVRASGPIALFTTPESKSGGEKFSAPYPYYEQLKSLVGSIFAKPEMIVVVDKVRILNPVRYLSMSVNEQDFKNKKVPFSHQPVVCTFLANVDYVIEFHIVENVSAYAKNRRIGHPDYNQKKYDGMMDRYIHGHCRKIPYFGTTDCMAKIEPWDAPLMNGKGYYDDTSEDLGLTYHGMNYPEQEGDGVDAAPEGHIMRRYAELKMDHGVIEFPRPADCKVVQVV